MAKSVDKKRTLVKNWFNWSDFELVVTKLWFSGLGSDHLFGDAILVKITLFIVLVMVKCIQLHNTKFWNKQLFCHKFFEMKSPKATKNNQKNGKKLGQRDNQSFAKGLRKQNHCLFSWLLSSTTILPRLLLSSQSEEWFRHFDRFICVDTDNLIDSTKFTTSKAALSTDQAILTCALHSEVWSCVGMGNSSELTFLQML